MDLLYVSAPIIGYLGAGTIKFFLNSIKSGRWAFKDVGMGSMPSTHNTITSTTFFVLGFGEGFSSPICGVALALMIIVAIDSLDLRKKIEGHAKVLYKNFSDTNPEAAKLRLRLSHTPTEVLGGITLGAMIAYSMVTILPFVDFLAWL